MRRAVVDTKLFDFKPNAARGRLVDARVRCAYADSIEAAFSSLSEHGAPSGKQLLESLRAGPVTPVVFAAYTDLVEAIFADNIDRALAIAHEMTSTGFGVGCGLRVVSLDDRDLGEGQATRYANYLDEDHEVRAEARTLSDDAFASAAERVEAAIALLDAALPELAGELRALTREIILVYKPGAAHFGASSFQLWGGLFLRPSPVEGRVVIAEALAHEAAHALLYGFGLGKPLVANDDPAELYPAPVVGGREPLDSVVHATYVLARMHYTGRRLLESGLLSEEEKEVAREEQERHMLYYSRGAAVIETAAKWTASGEAALNSAKAYMASKEAKL